MSPGLRLVLLLLLTLLSPVLRAEVTYDVWASADVPAGLPGMELRHTFPDNFSGTYQFTSGDLVTDPVLAKYGVPTILADSTAWISINATETGDWLTMPNLLLYGPNTGGSRPAYYGNLAGINFHLPHASDGSDSAVGVYAQVSDYDYTPAYYDSHITFVVTASTVPEPSTLALGATALAGLLAVRWKSRRRAQGPV